MIMQKLLYVYSNTSVFRVNIFRVKSLHFNICEIKIKSVEFAVKRFAK